ncbi:MAG: Rpn family recombination-promoting nuclease/putative transposase [Clostridia bacterium]|nr:Rpn family recombination-promoting nuclease/putative transposase [Clostridia bacterium]
MAAIPKQDIVFKKLFGSKGSEKILQDFLEYILEMKINSVNLDLSTELLPDFYEGKNSRVDVRAELSDGSQVNIEMQTDKRGFSEKRCLQYWSKIYSNSMEKSQAYSTLKRTICIWIVDDTIYDEIKEFETTWKMKEDKLGITGHFNEIEIHIIELKKFRETDIIEPKKKDFWLWFIDYTDMKKVEMACMDNERIREARAQLDKITSDKALMNEIIRQEMYEMDQIMRQQNIEKMATEKGMQEGLEKGMEKGMQKGMQKGLAEGEKNKQLEIAKKMKEMQIDVDTIVKATGLEKEEIEKL